MTGLPSQISGSAIIRGESSILLMVLRLPRGCRHGKSRSGCQEASPEAPFSGCTLHVLEVRAILRAVVMKLARMECAEQLALDFDFTPRDSSAVPDVPSPQR